MTWGYLMELDVIVKIVIVVEVSTKMFHAPHTAADVPLLHKRFPEKVISRFTRHQLTTKI